MDTCNDHVGQPFIFLCSTCNKLVCKQCITKTHISHIFSDIDSIKESDEQHFKDRIESLWDQIKKIISTIKTLNQTEKDIKDIYKELHDLLIQEEHKVRKIITSELEKSYSMIPQILQEINTTKTISNQLFNTDGATTQVGSGHGSTNGISDITMSTDGGNGTTVEDDNQESKKLTFNSSIDDIISTIENSSNYNDILSIETLFPNKQSNQYSGIEILHLITNFKHHYDFQVTEYSYKYDIEQANNIKKSIPTLNQLYDKNGKILYILYSSYIASLDLNDFTLKTKYDGYLSNPYSTVYANGKAYILDTKQLSLLVESTNRLQSFNNTAAAYNTSLCFDKKNNILIGIRHIKESYSYTNQIYKYKISSNDGEYQNVGYNTKDGVLFIGGENENSSSIYMLQGKTIYSLSSNLSNKVEYYSLEESIHSKIKSIASNEKDLLFILTKKNIFQISMSGKTCEKITKNPIICDATAKMIYVEKATSKIGPGLLIFNMYKSKAIGFFNLLNKSWSELKLPDNALNDQVLSAVLSDRLN